MLMCNDVCAKDRGEERGDEEKREGRVEETWWESCFHVEISLFCRRPVRPVELKHSERGEEGRGGLGIMSTV